jgi:hypothetical protein
MAKATTTAAFTRLPKYSGKVLVYEATTIWFPDRPQQPCGHVHATSEEAQHCSPTGCTSMRWIPSSQVRHYVKPTKAASTRKRKRVSA